MKNLLSKYNLVLCLFLSIMHMNLSYGNVLSELLELKAIKKTCGLTEYTDSRNQKKVWICIRIKNLTTYPLHYPSTNSQFPLGLGETSPGSLHGPHERRSNPAINFDAQIPDNFYSRINNEHLFHRFTGNITMALEESGSIVVANNINYTPTGDTNAVRSFNENFLINYINQSYSPGINRSPMIFITLELTHRTNYSRYDCRFRFISP